MNFKTMCNELVTIERQDGTRHEKISALVTAKSVLIPDVSLPIEIGDAILRPMPSGLVERLTVSDPGYHAAFHGMAAHYQVKYRKGESRPAGQPGYVVTVSGDNAKVNIGSVDNSITLFASGDMSKLAAELTALRSALLEGATDAEHYAAIGQIATAELAAKNGEASKIAAALSTLGGAGRWAWDAANKIGVSVAAEVIKSQAGL